MADDLLAEVSGNIRWYYAEVDEYEVLCVGEVEQEFEITPEGIKALARSYPHVIYFYVEKPERFKVVYAAHNGTWYIIDTRNEDRVVAQLQGSEGERLIKKTAASLNNEWERSDG